ncbi:uncharacterized protein [Nicotiana tomentosiformis]|uniref:uncharacterized protein n=1 Tax=Nicotiana tomentosiformis TaxID=4098 RepID=UPI00388CB5DE
MGIVEVSGVAFTIFQLSGAVYQWWQAYEEGRPADAALLTWAHFLEIFLREFVPQTLCDAWRTEFEQLHQGTISVAEYAIRFSELSRHALALVSTIRERVRRFIEGLSYGLRSSMAWELEMDTPFQQVLSPYHAILDCHAKTVTLAMPDLPWLEWRGTLDYIPSRVVSFLKEQRMVEMWFEAYLTFVRDVSANTPTVESAPVVRDFLDVFPSDLPALSSDRDIDSGIDLVQGIQPISIPPYCIALVDLKELKE